jgi:serine/threonine-protein kinase
MVAPQKANIPIGRVIASKYRVTAELGRGGMAAVYEAENVDIGKRVAIKVLAAELVTSSVVVERFLREARAAAAIRSPHICDVYDSGRLDDGRPYLVLERLEGESLYERMVSIGRLDVETTLTIVSQVAKGLTRAHAAGIVHRDLKPENLFLARDDDGGLLVKILDFGLAKFYQPVDGSEAQARLTRDGAVFGTPAYMSPEQVRGQGSADLRADLWAVGCIAFECLTGKTVWSTEQGVAVTFAEIAAHRLPDPIALRSDLPESFRSWFTRALERDVERRFQTAKELADALAETFTRPPLLSAPAMSDAFLPSSDPLASAMRSPDPVASVAPETTTSVAAPREGTIGAPAGEPRSRNALLLVAGAALTAAIAYAALRPAGNTLLPPASATVSSSANVASPSTSASSEAFEPEPADAASATASASAAIDPASPLERDVLEAQRKLSNDDLAGARADLERLAKESKHSLPAALLQHLDAFAPPSGQAPCRLAGIGRPRRRDLQDERSKLVAAGPPVIASMGDRIGMAWTEPVPGGEQVHVVTLDDALRPRSEPLLATPEGRSVQQPRLVPLGEHFLLTYWDALGPEAGAFARLLDRDGRIASAATLVARAVGGASSPTPTPLGSSRVAIAWIAPSGRNTDDLWLRRYDERLESTEEPTRLFTTSEPRAALRALTLTPSGEDFELAFRIDSAREHVVHRQRVTPDELASNTLDPKASALGTVARINTDRSRADAPSLACVADGCFVAWNQDGRDGIWLAYSKKADPTPLFRREVLPRRGRRPTLIASPTGETRAFWYERGKVMTGVVDRDGVHDELAFAHVTSSEQPAPSVVAGAAPGEWLVGWVDYEAGRLEPYAARLRCP